MKTGARAVWVSIVLALGFLLASPAGVCSEVTIPLPAGAVVRLGLGWITDTVFSPDGRYLAVGTSIGVEIRELNSLKMLCFHSGPGIAYTVDFSSDGRHVAVGFSDGTIEVVDVATNEVVWSAARHTRHVASVAFSSDGLLLASGSSDSTAIVWDAATGEKLHVFPHDGDVTYVCFDPNGRTLVTGLRAEGATFWDVSNERELLSYSGPSYVSSVAYSPDGRSLAVGTLNDRCIILWNSTSRAEEETLGESWPESLAFSPDGHFLASGGRSEVDLWDVTTGGIVCKLIGHNSIVESVAFSADGTMLASSSTEVILWDVGTGTRIAATTGHTTPPQVGHRYLGRTLKAGALTAEGHLLAASYQKLIKVWDTTTGAERTTLSGHTTGITSVDISPDSRLLASGSWDNTVKLWDLSEGRQLHSFLCSADVWSVAFSPDGKVLAGNVPGERCIEFWDVSSGKKIRSLSTHARCIAFSPDGELLGAGLGNGSVKLLDVDSGSVVRTLAGGLNSMVDTLAFSPDGELVAASGGSSRVSVWRVATGQEVLLLRARQPGHLVHAVTFSPDGHYLATTDGAEIRLWKVATGQEVCPPLHHGGSVHFLLFSSEGEFLASGSQDGTILLWDVASLLPWSPAITYVEIPQRMPTNTGTEGKIGFHDPDGDISEARFVVLEGDLEDFTLDLTKPPYSAQVEGLAEGSFNFEITVDQPGSYRIAVTLVDKKGLTSEPVEFSFGAISPTPPGISGVIFPPAITVNRAQKGLVKFEDLDGDIVQAQFEILEGDPVTIAIEPGMSFDPDVSGRTEGAFRFSVQATQAQTITLRLTLTDSAGQTGEPYEFTFEVEQ